jgi:hypothetical protein
MIAGLREAVADGAGAATLPDASSPYAPSAARDIVYPGARTRCPRLP